MRAYREGRADKDPTEYWYQGELGKQGSLDHFVT